MAKLPDDVPVKIVDNVLAPELFADLVSGVFLNNGNVHLTLTSRQCDYASLPNVFSDVVVGRIIMPFSAADNLVQFLGNFVERMKKQAASPPIDAPKMLQ